MSFGKVAFCRLKQKTEMSPRFLSVVGGGTSLKLLPFLGEKSMPWTQLQDPKNPVTLHKLFGSLENEERILDLFNALGPKDSEYEKVHFQKILSITPSPPPSSNLDDGLEGGEEARSTEALLSGHITYRLQDHRYKTHIVQLFVPQIAQCEKEAFFYTARTFMQTYLKDPETTSTVAAFIFTPFSIHDDFHKQPVNHCYTESNGEGRWVNTVEFTYIQLPTLTWELDELTYKKDFWYYFFKAFNNPDFHKIAKKKAEKVWGALQMLDPAQWTEEELNAYSKAQKAIALRQQKNPPEVELARREAYRLGLERGRQEKEGDDDDEKMSGYYQAHRMYFEGERNVQKIVKASGLAPYEVKDLIAQEERNDKQSLWRKHFEGKKAKQEENEGEGR